MNKKITMLLLAVVLIAMGLVFFTQMQHTDPGPIVADGTPTVDRDGRIIPKAAQKEDSGQPSTESPGGGSMGTDGTPKPVNLIAGRDFSPVNATALDDAVTEPPKKEDDAKKADDVKKADTAQAAREKSSGAPGLTPWTVPPKKEGETQKTTADAAAKATPKATEKPADAPRAGAKKTEDTSEPGVLQLRNIKLTPKGQNIHLRIEADGSFPCKTFVLTGPDRLVIDLPGKWKGVHAPSVPANQLVNKIRAGEQAAGPRVVLDLARPLKGHQVQRQGNAVEIVLQ